MSRRNGKHGDDRTLRTLRLTADQRTRLELEWKAAIEAPNPWLTSLVANASWATNRTANDVLKNWGLS